MVNGLLVIGVSYVGFILAYHTYGRWLGQRIFRLGQKKTPAVQMADGHDFVPSKKWMVFGHHFTSIAGTGPIVGPAIGVIWGWLPALIWVVFGSIFMGAVHDFGALVLSLRNNGRSIGDIAGGLISRRVGMMIFFIVCLALWIVIAIFGLIIAIIFDLFPESVGPVWAEIPIAIAFGFFASRYPNRFLPLSIMAIFSMCVVVVLGHVFPLQLPSIMGLPPTGGWTILCLIYACIAAALPVHVLLQPRDYLNAWQLLVALGLLVLGALATGFTGQLPMVAPAIVGTPSGAPPMMPFLWITIACGAISGFHSLVASGTTSKQLGNESDAQMVGYGSMLLEGALAVMIIVACCAGIGMGYPLENGQWVTGELAWQTHYASWGASAGLASKIHAVVIGCANMMTTLGIPQHVGAVIIGVFIASFAGTTLDTSTRLQRTMLLEFFAMFRWYPSVGVATLLAALSGGMLAFSTGFSGKGALQLWPVFGVLNQLLACIGLGVLTHYLYKKKSRVVGVAAAPFIAMMGVTCWASALNQYQFFLTQQWGLFGLNLLILGCFIGICYEIMVAVFELKEKKSRRLALLSNTLG
jgi:carbon starvation protein